MTGIPLFQINPRLDRPRLAAEFAATRRLQIRNFLTADTATTIARVLARETPWGLAWTAPGDGPHAIAPEGVASADMRSISDKIGRAMGTGEYAFAYSQFAMLEAYLKQRAPGSPHDLLVEHINDEPFLGLIREVTGIPEIKKADAQATLFAPGQFLALHIDSHVGEGWRIAYVMNFCPVDWKPDWGGYLNFYDDDGDVVAGYKPRFNALNIFQVPQPHNVTYVPAFAPTARFAITGWLRDR